MSQTIDPSLEALLDEMRAALRSLRTTNWTDLASVVNAAGRSVPLSSLAFGLVGNVDLGLFEINGGNPAAGPGGAGWYYGSPAVDVLVNGGGLIILTAGQLHAQGNKMGMYQSYRLDGPSDVPGAGAPTPVAAAYDRSVFVFDPGYGQGTDLGAATFGIHTGLAKGWYRVYSGYAASWSGGMFTYGSAVNRRIAALPF